MKKATSKDIPHVALRVSAFGANTSKVDAVQEHNVIMKTYGRVFFGKAGRSMHISKLNLIKKSIESSMKVCFILVRKTEENYEAFKASLYGIQSDIDKHSLMKIPKYYRESYRDINIWFEIGQLKLISNNELKKLVLLSNNRSFLTTLNSCRTSLMLVKQKD